MKPAICTFLAAGLLAGATGCHRAVTPVPAAGADTNTARLVSLAPSLTEIVCAVGGADRLVGRTDACNYPSNLVAKIPVVAGFGRPRLEPLLAQNPTLVLEVDLEDKSMGAAMERLGIRRRHIPCRRLGDIPGAIRAIGRLTDRAESGHALADAIEFGIRNRQAAVAQTPLEQRPLVFVEIWGEPVMSAGKSSFVAELVTLAGGRNLGDELSRDYGVVSTEWVLTRNPDIILCLYPGANHQARRNVAARLGWQSIRAVQQDRVFDEFDLDAILRPGPRVLEGVDQLRRVIAGKGAGTNRIPPAATTNAAKGTSDGRPAPPRKAD